MDTYTIQHDPSHRKFDLGAIFLWITGVTFLSFVPPVGIVMIIIGFVVQSRHKKEYQGRVDAAMAKAVEKSERERIVALRSLGRF